MKTPPAVGIIESCIRNQPGEVGWRLFSGFVVSLPLGPIPLVRGKCPEGTKGVGKVARAKPVPDEGNVKGPKAFE